jgi:hypothetical protein
MADPESANDGSGRRATRALRTLEEFLRGWQRVLAAAAGVLGGLAAVYAAYVVLFNAGSDGQTTTSAQTSVPSPSRSLSVRCKLDRPPRQGATIRLTYRFTSSEDMRVGLGAGLYDDEGNDQSTGYGDRDSVEIPTGASSATRRFLVPGDLSPGHYELNGEIWPENRVGAEGAEVLQEATCANFAVH